MVVADIPGRKKWGTEPGRTGEKEKEKEEQSVPDNKNDIYNAVITDFSCYVSTPAMKPKGEEENTVYNDIIMGFSSYAPTPTTDPNTVRSENE